MKPFDCHTHIYDDSFSKDLAKVIARAKKVLSGIIVVGEGPESNRKVLALCGKHPKFLFPGLAIHPDKVHRLTDKQIEEEINFIRKQKNLACIGECGLDYLWAEKSGDYECTKLRQQATFEKLIKLADEMGLPLNIHSRRATKPVVETLEKLKPKRALLHGFSGTLDEAKRAIALGYKIAISTTLLWKNNEHSLAYLQNLPLSTFVLETDSPVLAPRVLGDRRSPRGGSGGASNWGGAEPLRGSETDSPVLAPVKGDRNEPSNISLIIKEIARIKNISEEEVIKVTNKNAKEVFGL